ncbi:MAG: hypothetical protein SOR93_04905 [Clostridiales Family XIII bacterium]|nr:hypothetical protein [Clostridia bacterium]MDY3010589.1 hypothetical protein [Clostridiales Family XIII bacterium]
MSTKTENYNLKKPEETDFFSVNDLNTTLDLIDEIIKANHDIEQDHEKNKNNPHSVSKTQVGLGNVPNVTTNDQTPTFTQSAALTTLVSGEKLTAALGKIAKAIADLISHIGNRSNPHSVTKTQIGLGSVDNTPDTAKPISTAQQSALNKKADLDANGKVLSAQLPSYVDDVLEYAGKANFPSSGETGKIYVDTATNLTYRWSGSAYTEISPSIALGETTSTAYPGNKGKIAYEHTQNKSNPHSVSKTQVGLGNVPNVATNDQTPTFTEAVNDEDIASGEKLGILFGKLLKNIKTLRTGLAGKAASGHKHSADDVTSGTLPVARGGTGQTTAAGIKSAFGVTALETSLANLISDETIAAAKAAGIDLTV